MIPFEDLPAVRHLRQTQAEAPSLRSLIAAAWQAKQALNALYAPDAPLPDETVAVAAEERFYRARRAVCDWLLFNEGVPSGELHHLEGVL